MGALDGFYTEVECTRGRGADGGVARVCEGAGLAGAEAGDVVFIPAADLEVSGTGIALDLEHGVCIR